ncbi:MAG: hypothetical protein J7K54_04500 [Candidatus Aenigmarchaeota archaeon]|nr:hypothetical protein [Candidatus Aenigmarchaeota archaeon]
MKGQVWSFDLAVSMIIFIGALASVVFAWNFMSTGAFESQEMKSLQLRALGISDSLLRTPGIPEDWNSSNVIVLGLATDGLLDRQKVEQFISMDHNKTRQLLDLGGYEYYFEVSDINGTVYNNTLPSISPDAKIIVPSERYATYEGRAVKVSFVIWSE